MINIECGFILYKPRRIVVYDNNILEYYDPETKQKKGQINLNDVLTIDLVNKDKWTVTIIGRVYKFKVQVFILRIWKELCNRILGLKNCSLCYLLKLTDFDYYYFII
jgi:hypothetical protein